MKTRTISFAGQSVSVTYEGNTSRKIVDFLFDDLNEESDTPPKTTFLIHNKAESNGLILKRNDEEIYAGGSNGEMASMLMDQVLFHLMKGNSDGVLIHCAVLARSDFGILLPGGSGAGKSTLTAWLVKQGFNYLTDELAFIETGTNRIKSFTRPFNIKTRALPVIRDALQIDVDSEQNISNDRATLIPHRQVNPSFKYSNPEVGLVLYPRYCYDSEFQMNSLSPALAGLDLMKCLVNARNLDGDGFPEITRLVRQVPAYSMVYGGFEQLGNELFEILDPETHAR